jgi:hypothetical protein
MRFLSCVGLIGAVISLVACGGDVHVRVGEVSLCVPRENVLQSDIEWLPASIKSGGGRFRVNIGNIEGEKADQVVALLEDRKQASLWAAPSPNTPYGKVLGSTPGAYRKASAKQYLVVPDPKSGIDFWIQKMPEVTGSLMWNPVVDRLAAVCEPIDQSRSLNEDYMPCFRVIDLNGMYVQYRFHARRLADIDLMDLRVKSVFDRWAAACRAK